MTPDDKEIEAIDIRWAGIGRACSVAIIKLFGVAMTFPGAPQLERVLLETHSASALAGLLEGLSETALVTAADALLLDPLVTGAVDPTVQGFSSFAQI